MVQHHYRHTFASYRYQTVPWVVTPSSPLSLRFPCSAMVFRPLWHSTIPVYAVVVFAVPWTGFVAVLIVHQTWLGDLWERLGGMPIVFRIGVWVLFLPVTVGLRIWQSTWSPWVRLLGFGGDDCLDRCSHFQLPQPDPLTMKRYADHIVASHAARLDRF
jgi:hypothetical protein